MGSSISRTEVTRNKDTAEFVRYGASSALGGRRTQEDAYWALPASEQPGILNGFCRGFYVVCDGHGGADAAVFTSRNLLRFMLLHDALIQDASSALYGSFLRTDDEFRRQVDQNRLIDSGTTALAVAILKSRMLIGHVGDCRAILCRSGQAINLTTDHRPDVPEERHRIEAAGGWIDCEGYLNGDLQVSRAIGDFHYVDLKPASGNGPLIAAPEIREVKIDEKDEFLVLVSDGALQYQTPNAVVQIALHNLREFNSPQKAAEAVVHAATETGVRDNITVLICCLKNEYQKPKCGGGRSQFNIDKNSSSFASLIQAIETGV
eukprot:g6397.t1